MLRRRLGQVLAVAATVVLAGVLARPGVAPAPVEVDRGPAPATPAPTPDPDAGAAPGEAWLSVHAREPATLAVRADPVTVPLGGGVVHAASADAGVLALAGEELVGGRSGVVVLDAEGLRRRPPTARLRAPAERLAVSPAGEALVWLEPPSGSDAWTVRRLALRAGAPQTAEHDAVELPVGFVPDGIEPLAGRRVGVWGPGTKLGSVRVLVALPGGSVEGDVEVAGAVPATATLSAAPGDRRPGAPAVGWDADRERAYVAHVGDDRVTVVDPGRRRVIEVLYGARGAAPDPAVGAAVNGDIDGTRDLIVGPDGTTVYVGGWRLVAAPRGGGLGPRQLPLPLIALDLDDVRVLARRRAASERMLAVAPDGSTAVLAQGWWADGDPRRGALLKTATLSTTAALDGRAALTDAAYAADGHHVWLVRHAPGRAFLEVVDVDSGRVVAEEGFAGGIAAIYPEIGVVLVRER